MNWLIVYKWKNSSEIFNHFHKGSIIIDLKKVEAEIKTENPLKEDNLIYLNIIELGYGPIRCVPH